MKATLILPAYGVGDGVALVVRDIAVAAYALKTRGIELDLLVAGDAESETAATKAAAEYGVDASSFQAASRGEAYLTGYQEVLARGTADFVVTLDATGQHDATQLPRLIDELSARRLDVVIGSRWARGSSTPGLNLRHWALGRLANQAFRTITGIGEITDVTTAFRVARMNVLRQMDFTTFPRDPRAFQMTFIATAIANGRKVGEGPIIYQVPSGTPPTVTRQDIGSFVRYLPQLRGQSRTLRKRRLSPEGRQFVCDDFGAASDLEKLGTADHFFGWTLAEFRPFLRGRVLEVGAGLGTITRKLIDSDPELSVVALEPAENLFENLDAYASVTPRVMASKLTSQHYLKTDDERFDSIVYLNVLEHIEHDVEELRITGNALRPGGHVLVFGPALPWLYSELDYNAGHYRRYTVAGLQRVAEQAGLEVVSVCYFDVLGVLPYYLVYRLLRRQAISGSTMWGYDKVIVPVSRFIQRVLRKPPLGKNVILVARKPDDQRLLG